MKTLIHKIELLPQGDQAIDASALNVVWPLASGRSEHLAVGCDPFFRCFGDVPNVAIDLARVGVAAYMADRLTKRPQNSWSREIELVVHMVDPRDFEPVHALIESLLYWVTGDSWSIRAVRSTIGPTPASQVGQTDAVSLASGGLDSLCGVLLEDHAIAWFGHRDTNAVTHAQDAIASELSPPDYVRLQVRALSEHSLERSSRSRSIMFLTLATALAMGRKAKKVIVPENGFTSLNMPLSPDRGGPRTTRSTHPTTFAYFNAILMSSHLPLMIENPYQWMTKGQLLARAATAVGTDRLESLIPITYSCAKANTQFYKGGSFNMNCGICVACLTRRGAIRAAGLPDRTTYLIDCASTSERERFLADRGEDIAAVQAHRGLQPDRSTLVAMGPFPEGFDYDRALLLLNHGLEELALGLP